MMELKKNKGYQSNKKKRENFVVGVETKLFNYAYCVCGYEGLAVNKKCKKCKRSIDFLINGNEQKCTAKIIEKRVKEDNYIFRASIKRYVKDGKNFKVSEEKVKLRLNLVTGETYYSNSYGKEQNVSYGEKIEQKKNDRQYFEEEDMGMPGLRRNWLQRSMRGWDFDFEAHLFNLQMLEGDFGLRFETFINEQKNLIKVFLQEAFSLRGVKYRRAEDFVENTDKIVSAFIMIRFPILQHAPVLTFKGIPEKTKKELDDCRNPKNLWKVIGVNNESKTVRKLASLENRMSVIQIYSAFIEKQENIVNFIQNANGEEKAFAYYNEDLESFEKGIRLISKTHENELVWLKRIAKLRTKMDEREIVKYIIDIGSMYEQILALDKHYFPKETKMIESLHDELAREGLKLSYKSKQISLSENELRLEEKIGDAEFYLPRETYELIEAGRELNICIGSYGQRAVKKQTLIIFLKEKELKVCMEIVKGQIVQAKTNYNNKPNEKQKKVIQFWAKKHGLNIKTRDILTNETEMAETRWVGNQMYNQRRRKLAERYIRQI